MTDRKKFLISANVFRLELLLASDNGVLDELRAEMNFPDIINEVVDGVIELTVADENKLQEEPIEFLNFKQALLVQSKLGEEYLAVSAETSGSSDELIKVCRAEEYAEYKVMQAAFDLAVFVCGKNSLVAK